MDPIQLDWIGWKIVDFCRCFSGVVLNYFGHRLNFPDYKSKPSLTIFTENIIKECKLHPFVMDYGEKHCFDFMKCNTIFFENLTRTTRNRRFLEIQIDVASIQQREL